MSELVTIASFTLPSEMHVVKSKLESEGIKCYTLNELTVQSYNFISNAVGGVHIQVHRLDYENARTILKEIGYTRDQIEEPDWVYRFLANKSNLKIVKIFLSILGTLIIVIVVGLLVRYIINRPDLADRVSSRKWCIDHIVYNENIYEPYSTNGAVIKLYGECDEHAIFYEDGSLEFPGFNTKRIKGKWKLEEDSLTIMGLDTLNSVFSRTYKCEYDNKTLVLYSKQTSIICY